MAVTQRDWQRSRTFGLSGTGGKIIKCHAEDRREICGNPFDCSLSEK